MLGAILEYQKKDAQLVAIEREIADSKAKKVVNQMVSIVRDAQQKLVVIEKNASVLIEQFNALTAEFEKEVKAIEELNKTKFENKTAEELHECEKLANEYTTNMLMLEKNINRMSKNISDTLGEFEKTKNQGMQAKQRHAQGMQAYNALVASKQTEMDTLKKELQTLENEVDKKLLSKYKKMRDDKKFPVFVPLVGSSCGGCSMGLPTSQINKLDELGMLECENCRRVIYKTK